MSEVFISLLAMPYWEHIAVALGIIYLLLAMQQNQWCWYAAFVSTLIYTFLFWDASLLMESGLQIYYLLMAVYGWMQWRGQALNSGSPDTQSKNRKLNVASQRKELAISTWTARQHGLAIGGVLLLAYISGTLLANNTQAAFPYLDSFTTWAAVLTTYMVTRKVLENWIYWFVIDGLSIFLYLDRGLYPTAGLFVVYEVIVVIGYIRWRKDYLAQALRQSDVTI